MATYKPLQSVALTSATASVTFSGIDQGYTDLVVVASAKATNAANTSLGFQVNGDTGSNYSTTRLQGDGSTAASERSSNQTSGNFSGNSFRIADSDGNFSPIIFNMMNYANTATNKTFIARGNNASAGVGATISLWRNTVAITSLTIFSIAGQIDVGSTFSLYGIKSGAPQALGGDLVTTDGNYWYHTFRTTQTFTPLKPITVDYLVVAGGGGGAGVASGGSYGAPGGGAGGLRSTVTATGGGGSLESALSLTGQAYTVTVGAGGARSEKGSNSTLHTITSEGGGLAPAGSGGSGAGAFSFGTLTPGSGTANQGFAGAAAAGNTSPGGGGGAGGAGSSARTGGAGVSTSISGTSTAYAGGGAGGWGGTATAGGGNGGAANANQNGFPGTANTGGGGGGSSVNTGDTLGAPGGSGIVIVRYPV
jgi:hypothetical protein